MISKPITYDQLKEAVKISFTGDEKILSMYDPNVKVETMADVQKDILRKLAEFDQLVYMGIFEKGILVGYYVKRGGLLISFSISPSMRTRHFLRQFFTLIRKEFQSCFACFLWNTNKRAIKFLLKMGMQVEGQDNNITRLIYG
jgi:hypothetical protein